jgi:hypothetical protein
VSASVAVMIFCDHVCADCGSDCGGVFQESTRSSIGAVRARARGEGWAKGRVDGELVDYCPDHKPRDGRP